MSRGSRWQAVAGGGRRWQAADWQVAGGGRPLSPHRALLNGELSVGGGGLRHPGPQNQHTSSCKTPRLCVLSLSSGWRTGWRINDRVSPMLATCEKRLTRSTARTPVWHSCPQRSGTHQGVGERRGMPLRGSGRLQGHSCMVSPRITGTTGHHQPNLRRHTR